MTHRVREKVRNEHQTTLHTSLPQVLRPYPRNNQQPERVLGRFGVGVKFNLYTILIILVYLYTTMTFSSQNYM